MKKGTFTAISTGMLLAGHITTRCRNILNSADVTYCLVPHALSETWLEKCANKLISLQPFYSEGKYRMETYNEMVEAMMVDVRAGKQVCGAFYGHAGVFSCVPHKAIEKARDEGFEAYMEPGISAEACLYADLGIDPADYGVQSIEATQCMLFNHNLNNRGYILLWQIAIAGDHTAKVFTTDKAKINLLIDYLSNWIPLEHEVILYEAQFLPMDEVRKEKIPLKDLARQSLNLHTTLVIPPVVELEYDESMLKMLGVTFT